MQELKSKCFNELKNHGIFLLDAFFTQCFEYIKSGLDNENELKDYVAEFVNQVNKMSLKNVCVPPDVYSTYKMKENKIIQHKSFSFNSQIQMELHDVYLKGPIILEILDIIDISQPTYEFVDELEEEESNDGIVDNEISNSKVLDDLKNVKNQYGQKKRTQNSFKKRMLKLKCTDGRDVMFGVEHKPISWMGENTRGKIILNNVFCRRGLLLFNHNCVKLLIADDFL